MKLENPITINPPPHTDINTNKIVYPDPIILNYLDISYHINEASKVVSATIKNIPGSFIIASGISYEKLGDFSKSVLNNLFHEQIRENTAEKLRAKFPKTLEENPNGPGTILTNMISSIGIKSSPTCSCRRHALEMNEKGPEWCEQNLGVILQWLKEESNKRHLPYVESVASIVVKRAINTSKRLLKKEKEEQDKINNG
jgi:hypothetical protein